MLVVLWPGRNRYSVPCLMRYSCFGLSMESRKRVILFKWLIHFGSVNNGGSSVSFVGILCMIFLDIGAWNRHVVGLYRYRYLEVV